MAILTRGAQVATTFGAALLRHRHTEPLPRRIRDAFVALGPTYVKLGQLIASSPGLFPPEWANEFGVLRDQVPPFSGVEARKIIRDELAMPISRCFADFDDEPIAAASIGQVHGAILKDGTPVVVKVQRPNLDAQVGDDVRAMKMLAAILDRIPYTAIASPKAVVDDFARTLEEEMDYRLEADNMERMRSIIEETGIKDCRVPRVYLDLVGKRVLTMERIDGIRFHDVEAMKAAGIDTARLLRMGVQTVVEGVLLHGFFHGDLHAGNIVVLEDGTFVLFDFGIVGRLTESVRTRLAQYLIAVTTNDYESMVRALRAFGSIPKDVDLEDMAAEIQRLYEPFVQDGVIVAQLGELMNTMIRSMVRYKVRIPRELVLLSKQMLYLEGAARTLAPEIDLLEEQQVIYTSLMAKYPELGQELIKALSSTD
ncbi:MAG TPA: AarF/UbiB family protein [Acidimicrobiales bacterium]|nr:AarF/UbiB family protein [Acidimicrobiales bacterium]